MTRKTLAKECADWIRRKAQAAFNALQQAEAGENLKASIARDEEIQKLKDRIEKLQAKMRKEKRLNHAEIKSLRKELEEKQ